MPPRVLLADQLDDAAHARLTIGAEVVLPTAPTEAAWIAAIGDCDAAVFRTHNRVTRAVLEAGRRLRCIGVAGVGVDNVDTSAARERGIAVLHTPGASSDAVAEFTVALILNLLRPIRALEDAYCRGEFVQARLSPHGPELRGLTVGILGMGRIGRRVGRICAAGFGARVIYNDILPIELRGEFDCGARAVGVEELWRESDVLTLHVPLTDATRGMISADVLTRLRPQALLINTCRGAVVDTAALTAALKSGALRGAALDVVNPEPLPESHDLWTCGQCILTPHVAARTHAGVQRMFGVADDVLAFLRQNPGSDPAGACV